MASVDPNLGLSYGWTLGESGWKDGMDANLKRLGVVVGLSVKDRDLGTPPASPVDGDRYIIPAGASGVWSGRSSQIAVRIGGAWEFHVPNPSLTRQEKTLSESIGCGPEKYPVALQARNF